MLEVAGLRKSFAGFVAVSDVSFTVETQQIAAVIGPNGAGKSTLFNLITGHLQPDSGTVTLDGQGHHRRPAAPDLPHGDRPLVSAHQHLPAPSVFENVQAAFLVHRGRGRDFWSRSETFYRDDVEALLAQIGLLEHARSLAGTLSYGNQKQLELGLALASDPALLLLDEPTAGMSATETHDTIALIEKIAGERALTLLFTEHDMEVVFSIAQKIAVLHQGRLIADGAPQDVRNDPDVAPRLSGRA